MKKALSHTAALLGAGLLISQSAYAADILVFQQDFEAANISGYSPPSAANLASNISGIAATQSNPTYSGITETIFASSNTRSGGDASNGVVTQVNWDIHDGTKNPWVSGGESHPNPNMTGNVLGHVDANYTSNTANTYQIDGIDLAGQISAELRFDFDSWISAQQFDGFGVAYSVQGQDAWALLNPSTVSDNYSEMQYGDHTVDYYTEKKVAQLTGQCTDTSGSTPCPDPDGNPADVINFRAFNGHEALAGGATNAYGATMDAMAGTAIFDLSSVGENIISLRFVFASDGDSAVEEGINIDNIIVKKTTDDPNGGNNVPEPLTFALALAGVAYAGRRKKWLKK